MSNLMGGFTQHCSCDNVFPSFLLQISRKIDCGQWESAGLVEMSLASYSINLNFLNSTFICIYNISRFSVLSWVNFLARCLPSLPLSYRRNSRVLVLKNKMLKQFLHILPLFFPSSPILPAICQVSFFYLRWHKFMMIFHVANRKSTQNLFTWHEARLLLLKREENLRLDMCVHILYRLSRLTVSYKP